MNGVNMNLHKNNLFVSFSGGKTSAYMCYWIKENHPDKNLVFVFANTGQEHPKTYEFLDKCNNYFSLDLKIVEARITEKGTKHTLVDFQTMKRDSSLFENIIKKYGIPNQGYPHCTRELKLRPMKSYVDSIFGKKNYITAIGIRSDEIDRINSKYEELNYYYPLAWNGITKKYINDFWETMPFNLEIPEHLGNCIWCWKKAFSKHMKIIEEMPQAYDVPKMLEKKYCINEIAKQKLRFGKKQTFFRQYMSANDLFDSYKESKMEELKRQDELDNYENSCKESCEPMI